MAEEPTNPNPEPTPTEPTPAEPTPAEPTLLAEPAPAPPAQPEPKPEPTILDQQVSPVKTDLTFIEGWRDKLPEEIRNEECLKLLDSKNFTEMANQFVNQRKAIGKNKVAVPTDKSDENEWNAFFEAIGRPKTHTGYMVPDIPKDLKEIYDEPMLEENKKFAHQIGATQKQFTEYLKFDMARAQALMAEEDETEAREKREARLNAEKELRTDLGAAYDERMHVANRIITEAIPKEQDRLEFIEQYGNDVKVIRLLSTIGARMSEHTALIAELTQKTPTEIEQRIKKLESDERYRNINSGMSKEERQQITAELRELYKQRYPEKKTG